MNDIFSQIQLSKSRKQLICICLNKIDWNKRIIGYVLKIPNTKSFVLQVVNEYGRKLNRRNVAFNSVESLELGGEYNKSLEQLSSGGLLKKTIKTRYVIPGSKNFSERMLELKREKTICTFFFETEFSIGVLTKSTTQDITLKNISYFGKNDGISIFKINALSKIRLGSKLENKIAYLRQSALK